MERLKKITINENVIPGVHASRPLKYSTTYLKKKEKINKYGFKGGKYIWKQYTKVMDKKALDSTIIIWPNRSSHHHGMP